MSENPNENKGIESGCDAGEPEIKRKGSNLGEMQENPKQKEGIKSWRNAIEPETKGRDRICLNAREPGSKQRDRIWARCWRT